MHRRPDLLHRSARHRPRAATSLVQDLHDPIRFLHELLAPLADLLERRHHVLEQHVLAVETPDAGGAAAVGDELQRSEEHTSELQSLAYLVCRLLLEKKKNKKIYAFNK